MIAKIGFPSKSLAVRGMALVLFGVMAVAADSQPGQAQVNCGVLPHGQQRAACYGREAQIYRQQANQYNRIAQQQYQQHQQIGRALRYAPVIGPSAQQAWNAPRYVYQFGYGQPR